MPVGFLHKRLENCSPLASRAPTPPPPPCVLCSLISITLQQQRGESPVAVAVAIAVVVVIAIVAACEPGNNVALESGRKPRRRYQQLFPTYALTEGPIRREKNSLRVSHSMDNSAVREAKERKAYRSPRHVDATGLRKRPGRKGTKRIEKKTIKKRMVAEAIHR